jgi:hypothetical protein
MKTVLQLTFITLLPFVVGLAVNGGTPESVSDSNSVFYPEHLDGAYTGGFGEETCRSCHFDYDLNMDGGSLTVDGLDEIYNPGQVVPITVTVQSEQLEIGGFQMSARFEDGSQAGSFKYTGDELIFTPGIEGPIQYIQHSNEGTVPENGRSKSWSFNWVAPENGATVLFNVSANAGNYDDSSFGDWIYSKEITVNTE